MGNCFERVRSGAAKEKEAVAMEIKEGGRDGEEEVKKNIKIVLTKAEVEWLMQQAGEKQGGMKLQDMLQELADGRRWDGEEEGEEEESRWRPELDSIMEAPEVPSFDNPTSTEAAPAR